MARNDRIFIAACALGALTGCHTLTGVVSGPALGGASLTSRLWNGDAGVASKVFVTPFAFAAGTVAGPVVTVTRGMNLDLENPDLKFEAEGYLRVLDAFEGGLFDGAPPPDRSSPPEAVSQASSAPAIPAPQ